MKVELDKEFKYDEIIDCKIADYNELEKILNLLTNLKKDVEDERDNKEFIDKYGDKFLTEFDIIYNKFLQLQCDTITKLKKECVSKEWLLMFDRGKIFTKHELDNIEKQKILKSRQWLTENKNKLCKMFPNCTIEPYCDIDFSFGLDGKKDYTINIDVTNIIVTPNNKDEMEPGVDAYLCDQEEMKQLYEDYKEYKNNLDEFNEEDFFDEENEDDD